MTKKLCSWQLGAREFCKLQAEPFDDKRADDDSNVKYCLAHQLTAKMAYAQTRFKHPFVGAFWLNRFNGLNAKSQRLVIEANLPKSKNVRVVPPAQLARFIQDADAVRRGTITQQALVKLAKQQEQDSARQLEESNRQATMAIAKSEFDTLMAGLSKAKQKSITQQLAIMDSFGATYNRVDVVRKIIADGVK